MKKGLLTLAAMAFAAASMTAASYTVFDSSSMKGDWTAQGTGFATTVTVDGKKFVISTDKGSSTTALRNPGTEQYAWRVYKNSSFTIQSESFDMKTIVITYDNYVDNTGKGYSAECKLSEGWTGTLDNFVYTLKCAGSKTLTATADQNQVRITKVVVSDSESVDDPVTPPSGGVIYQNAFNKKDGISDWTITKTESYDSWYVNETIGCLVANSYDSENSSNRPADTWISREFDLAGKTGVKLDVEQAFGFYFPTSQESSFVLAVRENGGSWTQLDFTSFPEKPEKNWSDFAANTFSLAAYDGKKIEIGFHYTTDGTSSKAWELKNFKLYTDGGEVDPPVTDPNLVYGNTFEADFEGWKNTNEGSVADNPWYINKTQKCLVASSYKDEKNYAVNSMLSREFDLTGRTGCALSFEQAFGFVAPQAQDEKFVLKVREAGGEWYPLVMTNYPAAPEKGNWTKFVVNEFDLSEYDGTKIEIGFNYVNTDATAMAWELKNFRLTGVSDNSGVDGIDSENSPVYFFNLQGARVNNPENGIFIRVQGNKTQKVIVK